LGFALYPGNYAINESQGTPVEPASLFEAQLEFRLSPDKDEDGLEDTWERAYFTNLTTTAGLSTEDFDSDLFIDRSKFHAGTIPTDSNSLLRITMLDRATHQSPMNVMLSWDAVTGEMYHVMGNTNLVSSWNTLWTIEATNTSPTYEFQTDENPLFFKIEVEH
jgi:hypothetical protein